MYGKHIKLELTCYGDFLNPETDVIVIEATINRTNALKLAEDLLHKVNSTQDTHIEIIIGGYPRED